MKRAIHGGSAIHPNFASSVLAQLRSGLSCALICGDLEKFLSLLKSEKCTGATDVMASCKSESQDNMFPSRPSSVPSGGWRLGPGVLVQHLGATREAACCGSVLSSFAMSAVLCSTIATDVYSLHDPASSLKHS